MSGLDVNKKFRIDADTDRQLAAEAKRADRSEGAVIRVALREYLDRAKRKRATT